jgi:hypothetical protein
MNPRHGSTETPGAYMKRIVTALLLIAISPLQACGMQYSAEAIEAWVVDAETNQPLEGVIVVAHWQLYGGMHPDNAGELTILETVTDNAGRFHFPAWGPKALPSNTPSNARLTYLDPEILIFKSGYRHRRIANEMTTERLGNPAPSLRRSEWNGKNIKLTKSNDGAEEYAEDIYNLSRNIDSITDAPRGAKECNWKMVPRMLIALHKMSLQLKAQDVKLPGWRGGQRIPTIDDLPGDPRCGSKDEFFRSYVQ